MNAAAALVLRRVWSLPMRPSKACLYPMSLAAVIALFGLVAVCYWQLESGRAPHPSCFWAMLLPTQPASNLPEKALPYVPGSDQLSCSIDWSASPTASLGNASVFLFDQCEHCRSVAGRWLRVRCQQC